MTQSARLDYVGRLKMAMKARDKNQEWLEKSIAKARGTSARGKLSTLFKRGAKRIDIETAEQFAMLLDVDACWLILGRGEMGRYVGVASTTPTATENQEIIAAGVVLDRKKKSSPKDKDLEPLPRATARRGVALVGDGSGRAR